MLFFKWFLNVFNFSIPRSSNDYAELVKEKSKQLQRAMDELNDLTRADRCGLEYDDRSRHAKRVSEVRGKIKRLNSEIAQGNKGFEAARDKERRYQQAHAA